MKSCLVRRLVAVICPENDNKMYRNKSKELFLWSSLDSLVPAPRAVGTATLKFYANWSFFFYFGTVMIT